MVNALIGCHTIVKSRKTHELIATGLIIDHTEKIIAIRIFNNIHDINYDIEMIVKSFSNDFCLCTGQIVAIERDLLMIANLNVISQDDKRRFERIDYKTEFLLVSDFIKEDLIGNIKNISESGFLFKTDMQLLKNDNLSIQFPIQHNSYMDIFDAKATIVRTNNNFYGCKFTDISVNNLERLKQLISEKSIRYQFFKKKYDRRR